MAVQLGCAHGLPKAHKAYANLRSYRPIFDTTCTPYYNIGKFLSSLLQPLTHNDYNLKDSVDAVKRIRLIPPVISYLTIITSLFLFIFNHYLPMWQLKRQSTSF